VIEYVNQYFKPLAFILFYTPINLAFILEPAKPLSDGQQKSMMAKFAQPVVDVPRNYIILIIWWYLLIKWVE
jgi:hypothetical protein